MKLAFIAAKMAVFPITVLCKVLDVSRAAFHASVDRPPSAHTAEDRRLAILVREAFERSRRTYGSPRIHAELAAQGIRLIGFVDSECKADTVRGSCSSNLSIEPDRAQARKRRAKNAPLFAILGSLGLPRCNL